MNFLSRLIGCFYEKLESLLECFETIESSNFYDEITVGEAIGLLFIREWFLSAPLQL